MARHIRYDAWPCPEVRWGAASEATWTTPWRDVGFAFTDLVASWSATTPRGTWIEVAAQARGTRTWHVLGRWASGPTARHRTSVTGDPEVDTDIWRPPGDAHGYRLRLTLQSAGSARPHVSALGAVVSAGEVRDTTSSPLRRRDRILDVPRLSQMKWKQVGGAGWCSPAAVSMVLSHAGTLPPATDTGSVDLGAAAAEVVDPAYGDGTGNWPFNTAWAASLTGHAFVTRLHDLRDAERFVDAGIPLVASVAYPRGELKGAPSHGTDGHLVSNDPGAPTDRSVRRTYDRGQFERAWLDGSGGLVYVIHRDDKEPPSGSRGAW